jgi:hypothetical protein
MQLYKSLGIKLPHSSRGQFRYGAPVSRKDLLPGDLLFFKTGRGGISHVGMYIGDSRMIHAANPRKGVRIDSLNAPYYSRRYAGARRLLPAESQLAQTLPPAVPPVLPPAVFPPEVAQAVAVAERAQAENASDSDSSTGSVSTLSGTARVLR